MTAPKTNEKERCHLVKCPKCSAYPLNWYSVEGVGVPYSEATYARCPSSACAKTFAKPELLEPSQAPPVAQTQEFEEIDGDAIVASRYENLGGVGAAGQPAPIMNAAHAIQSEIAPVDLMWGSDEVADKIAGIIQRELSGASVPQPPTPLDLRKILEAIEHIVGDDFCEDLDCEHAFRPEQFSERETIMHEKLSAAYRIAHAFNDLHCCYDVHDSWRKGAGLTAREGGQHEPR